MEKRDPSLAGIVIDPDANVFTLYVHGNPNAASHKAVQAQTGKGFRVVVSQAPYSRAALDQAQDKLWQQHDTLGIEAVAVREDGTGLVADIRERSTRGRTLSPADQSLDAITGGVPVTVQQGSWVPSGAGGTRISDTSPYRGGARLFGEDEQCTSSFAVRDASSTYLVTAGHCYNTNATVYTGSGIRIGTVTFNALTSGNQLDAELIKTTAAEGYIYDGAYNDGNGYRKPVAGYRRPTVGMYVCQSGSFSGATCNIKVTYMGQRATVDGRSVLQDLAEQQNHTTAAGQGDSGGPVFTVSPDDNYARMTVVGTTSLLYTSTQTTCQGEQGRVCTWKMGFARFDNLRIYANITAVLTKAS